ncbi:MAG: hypothetical protein E7665_04590 [Ruminococcaceae bacterium]|nr:hypothetical protein [Oscillospiraceae bacterium]
MRTRKRILFLAMAVFMIANCFLPFTVNAALPEDNLVSPLANNVRNVSSSFDIMNGVAEIEASYIGYQGTTTGATITVKLQKKFLFWWNDVDNGQPDDTWTANLTGWKNSVSYSLALSNTGDYRAVFTYTIRGTGGADDEISDTLEYTY